MAGKGTWDWGVSVQGDKEFSEKMQRLARKITDYSPVWPEVEQTVMGYVRANIASKGANVGHTWAPLDKEYQASKAGKVKKSKARKLSGLSAGLSAASGKTYTGGMLVRTGKLLSSIGAFGRTTHNTKIGSRVPYAPFVNFGSLKNNHPPRPFLYSTERGLPGALEAVKAIFNKFVKQAISAMGGY